MTHVTSEEVSWPFLEWSISNIKVYQSPVEIRIPLEPFGFSKFSILVRVGLNLAVLNIQQVEIGTVFFFPTPVLFKPNFEKLVTRYQPD